MMQLLRLTIIGLLISLSCSYVLMTLSVLSTPNAVMTGPALLKQVVIAVILGIIIGMISLIFETERIPFTLQLMIHFIAVTICVLTLGYFGDWYDVTEMSTVMNILFSIVIIYGITWCILYVLMKRDIKVLNKKIQKRKEHLS